MTTPEFDGRASRRIVDVAAAIMHADFASVQRYDAKQHALRLINYRGLPPHHAAQLSWIYPHSGTSCAVSLSTGRRTIIPDIERTHYNVARDVLRACGIRAMHTTPLRRDDGILIGMCSTHWRTPHTPDDDAIMLFDIWAKQISDYFVRNIEVSQLLREAAVQIARGKKMISNCNELIFLLRAQGNQRVN